MSRHGRDWYRRPGLILAELIKKEARGDNEQGHHYYRATVLAVDQDGGMLQNPNGIGGIDFSDRDGRQIHFDALHGIENPRGSIKARILTDGFDRLLDDASTRIFWPMFAQDHIGSPISPGEHVYVIFEGRGMAHGMWLSRVSGHDSANSFRGSDSYTATSNRPSAMDSFEQNESDYSKDDGTASLAPPINSNSFFEDDDV